MIQPKQSIQHINIPINITQSNQLNKNKYHLNFVLTNIIHIFVLLIT